MLNPEVSQRMAMLRFLMIFGVVVLHVPPYVNVADVPLTAFDSIKSFFQNAAFRASVPVLTFISGYLLFSTDLATRPAKLYKKKALTLGVPFLFFNMSVLAVAWAAMRFAGISISSDLEAGGARAWIDAAFAYSSSPINYPLSFLRDMMVLMLLAPLFLLLLRKLPFVGLALVYIVFMNDFDGLLVRRSVMPVLFYVGGLAAVRRFDMTSLDRFALPCLLLFVAACAAVVAFRVTSTVYLALSGPFLIWPAAALLVDTRLGRFLRRLSPYSFFLFLAHAPFLMAVWIVYQRALKGLVPYQLFWVVTPFVVALVLIAVYRAVDAVAPRFLALVTGAGKARGGADRAGAAGFAKVPDLAK